MSKKEKKLIVRIFLIFIVVELMALCSHILDLISIKVSMFLMVVIACLFGLMVALHFYIKREEKIKKELETKVVALEDIKKNVNSWINEIRHRVFNLYEDNYYTSPRIQCPNCFSSLNGIKPETMRCERCGFIIPEQLQPPEFNALLEFFKEERRKNIEKEKKKKEEKREEMIFRAKGKLSRIGYQFDGDKE
jgi:Ca2+/Na+ antiporter